MQDASGDSPDLEALFDSVAAQYRAAAEPAATTVGAAPDSDVHSRIGHLLRRLYDTLHELGYDRSLERVVASIPDANDRLNYVIDMTEQAATRALSAIEEAKPIQQRLKAGAAGLEQRWQKLLAGALSVDEFKTLVNDNREYLAKVPPLADQTSAQLLEIMMAQDFQDLTGQVIKRLIAFTAELQTELAQILVLSATAEKRAGISPALLGGPVVKSGSTEVVTSQKQVDDLLANLGF